MKTKLIILACILMNATFYTQDWNLAGNNALSTSRLGTNNLQPLNIYTNGNHRAEFSQTETINVAGFNLQHGGFLGLSNQPNFFTKGPSPCYI